MAGGGVHHADKNNVPLPRPPNSITTTAATDGPSSSNSSNSSTTSNNSGGNQFIEITTQLLLEQEVQRLCRSKTRHKLRLYVRRAATEKAIKEEETSRVNQTKIVSLTCPCPAGYNRASIVALSLANCF